MQARIHGQMVLSITILMACLLLEGSNDGALLLLSPYSQIGYIIIQVIYYAMKKWLGACLLYFYIPSGYLLIISLPVNIFIVKEYMDFEEDLILFWIVQLSSLILSILFIYKLIKKCRRNRNQHMDIDPQIIMDILQDEGEQFEIKNNFNQIPSIIFQAFTPLKSDECAICLTKYEQDDTIKVLPGCFHTFHAECIKEWFENNPTCPFCRREFTLDDIQRCEGMSEDEIYRCIQASDVRPSLFNGPQRMDPRDSLNTPYNPNYKG
ncbi:unnamed protein product [Moneuplotes crassus]|uniref:RING-type domain-containing protein n=1 Tax=Euplotes crassus TaxID=5936 RepID=A0AAD1XUM6_EUPCR|nr:unnamed protein product [Moneuplotes crassus]